MMVYGEVADSVQGEPVPLYKRPQFRSDAAWRAYAERVTEFARYLLAQGIRLHTFITWALMSKPPPTSINSCT